MRIIDWSSDVCSSDLWHEKRQLPLGEAVAGDARCRLLGGDFCALAQAPGGFGETRDGGHDAIIVDIDHSTTHFIDEASAGFYNAQAIAAMTAHLRPGGVFALWSTDAEDPAFLERMLPTLSPEESRVGKECVRTCSIRWTA